MQRALKDPSGCKVRPALLARLARTASTARSELRAQWVQLAPLARTELMARLDRRAQ